MARNNWSLQNMNCQQPCGFFMMAMSFHRVDLRVPGFGQVSIEVSSICSCGCENEMVSIIQGSCVIQSRVTVDYHNMCMVDIFFHRSWIAPSAVVLAIFLVGDVSVCRDGMSLITTISYSNSNWQNSTFRLRFGQQCQCGEEAAVNLPCV